MVSSKMERQILMQYFVSACVFTEIPSAIIFCTSASVFGAANIRLFSVCYPLVVGKSDGKFKSATSSNF